MLAANEAVARELKTAGFRRSIACTKIRTRSDWANFVSLFWHMEFGWAI